MLMLGPWFVGDPAADVIATANAAASTRVRGELAPVSPTGRSGASVIATVATGNAVPAGFAARRERVNPEARWETRIH